MNKVKIDKLVFGGQGFGRIGNKVVFLWNTLPEEEVEFKYTKNKTKYAEGVAVKILSPSPYRITPREDHYLYCSQWQMIDWGREQEWKKEIAIETYKKIGRIDYPSLEIISDDIEFNYRNKIEYNFIERNGKVSFAVFVPQSQIKDPIDVCELARPEINQAARDILEWINQNKIRDNDLNKIILRSNQKGEVLAGLFLNTKIQFENYPELTNGLAGFGIYHINSKNTLSIYQSGNDYLEEELFGIKMCYGLFSFFQINVDVFKKTLADIVPFVQGEDLVDYYSGVGAIGLGLREHCKKLVLVESNREASEYARANADLNKYYDVQVVSMPAEDVIDYISYDKTIVFDPPRAGLNKKIIKKIILAKPKKIIYLSCNLSTQARDIGALIPYYNIKLIKLYNYFPRTPHIEGLCVLEGNH